MSNDIPKLVRVLYGIPEERPSIPEELFILPETLSPRLAWMRKHGITTMPPADNDQEQDWLAWRKSDEIGDLPPMDKVGEGGTENDALLDLAAKLNIKDWRQ